MNAAATHNLVEISKLFEIPGTFQSAVPYGSGHINDTYAAHFEENGNTVRYIAQRINHDVFLNPPALMENVQRVTEHLQQKIKSEVLRRVLTLVPAQTGGVFAQDDEGNYWRVYHFIEGAKTYDAITSPQQAYEAARAFGAFQRDLTDLPGPSLHETIVDFHHTPKRFAALELAVSKDPCNRAKEAKAEIDFALTRKDMCHTLLDLVAKGEIPMRITHNDCKLNNVMIDDTTGEGICVIDLDTIMPGLAHYDFGDMVRTATSPTEEDEKDLSKIYMHMDMFETLAKGYLSTAAEFLNPVERALLPFAGRLITFEIGIRFLTDFLQGDTYFKTHRPRHNLDRTRTQLKLVASIEEQEEAMVNLVQSL